MPVVIHIADIASRYYCLYISQIYSHIFIYVWFVQVCLYFMKRLKIQLGEIFWLLSKVAVSYLFLFIYSFIHHLFIHLFIIYSFISLLMYSCR